MQKSNWQELDFKVASDYTHGSPEYYRTLLRQMIGIPNLLPGEKNDTSTKQYKSSNIDQISNGGYMSGILHKGKR
jgi:hypothetical protein